jgi:hypothetical protein
MARPVDKPAYMTALTPPAPDVAVTPDDRGREALAADPVVAAAVDPERAAEVLDQTIRELAVECASIGFERLRVERESRDVGPLCSRRVSGLTQIAALAVERHRHRPNALDVRGHKFQGVVNSFISILKETALETLAPATAERFLTGYQAKLSGWEDKVDPPPPRGRTG